MIKIEIKNLSANEEKIFHAEDFQNTKFFLENFLEKNYWKFSIKEFDQEFEIFKLESENNKWEHMGHIFPKFSEKKEVQINLTKLVLI